VAEFYQTGVVATLDRLNARSLEALDEELEVWSVSRPIGLVLPAPYAEFKTPAITTAAA
jgi:glucosyl-3-phosphoglycerate synthase